ESLGARDGFPVPFAVRSENDPVDFRVIALRQQPQDGPATADFDIVAVGADTQNSQREILWFREVESQHVGIGIRVWLKDWCSENLSRLITRCLGPCRATAAAVPDTRLRSVGRGLH